MSRVLPNGHQGETVGQVAKESSSVLIWLRRVPDVAAKKKPRRSEPDEPCRSISAACFQIFSAWQSTWTQQEQ
jgi:hypothetical protein